MSHNTHSNVGQNTGRVLYARARAGASSPPIASAPCQVAVSQSPVTSHQSPRSGISLTEVLIAMGILTVGLLGVAAIFPVAGFYMQRGDIADRGSAIAQAAFNNAVASGQLDPANWWMMSPTDFEDYTMSVDGPLKQTFSRPVLAAIEECKVNKVKWSWADYGGQMGGIYVIDPLGVAALTTYDVNTNPSQVVARQFPAVADPTLMELSDAFGETHWRPWISYSSSPDKPALWPIRRVTYRQPRFGAGFAPSDYFLTTQPFDRQAAERRFTSGDDLAIDVPTPDDQPSQQQLTTFDLDGTGPNPVVPLARQSKGDYSWIITVVPRDIRNLAGATCEVSVVVFYKRPLSTTVVTNEDEARIAAADERITWAKIVSSGLNGGEVLLEAIDDDGDGLTDDGITESPFANLKKGRWIMLSGPSPTSTMQQPQFVARWYQILAIDDNTDNGIVENATTQRLLTLRGPQLPWQPATDGSGGLDLNDEDQLSNNLSATIIPGAVAVHSKTIRLEGPSAWSMQ